MNKQKIFCIGLNKTGTTSMAETFRHLGFKIGDQRKGELLMYEYIDNKFDNIIELCKSADFFQDLPFSFPETYKYLEKHFPEAKFILTVRDNPEQWYNSLYKFHQNLFFKGKKITPEFMKNISYVEKGWNYKVFKIYNTPDDDLYNKEILIEFYKSHNENIINYFKNKQNKLLVINLSHKKSFDKLKDFLKISNTNGINDFFHLNKT